MPTPPATPTRSIPRSRIVGVALLLSQVVLLGVAGVAGVPDVLPTPCAAQTHYRLFASGESGSLSRAGVWRRYRLARTGRVAATPERLRAIIRAAEQEDDSGVFVRLHTEFNGGAEEIWLWPEK